MFLDRPGTMLALGNFHRIGLLERLLAHHPDDEQFGTSQPHQLASRRFRSPMADRVALLAQFMGGR